MKLVLSLFPGIDLFGRAFEAEGFCVVRGPDLIFGGDMRDFHVPAGKFDGIIGGPPCQDFSAARRHAVTGLGEEFLRLFARAIDESQPEWFCMENVPRCPNLWDVVPQIRHTFRCQRLDVSPLMLGGEQNRLRHFQFGARSGHVLSPLRFPAESRKKCDSPAGHAERCCIASEARRAGRRDFPRFCALQGLPSSFTLPGFTIDAAYRAVGNGVPLDMGRAIARAIAQPVPELFGMGLCACGCGRERWGREKCASPGCRKRLQRSREVLKTATVVKQ